MEWQDLLADNYQRVHDNMERILDGLSPEDLNWQPRKDCNSIGWLLWHLSRQQDVQVASLMAAEQLWIKDKWHARFYRAADPTDTGFGHTPEQVASFKSPAKQVFLDYQQAVAERSKQYFYSMSAKDLDRELDEPRYQPLPTVGVRLISILGDSLLHAGQAAYIRGLHHGKGWQKY